MRRLLTGLIALSWAAASSASQDSPHVTAAGLYRHGEAHAARAALSVLSEKATRLSIDQFVEVGPSSVDVAAAVLVHAELVQTAPGAERGKMHVDAATKLLEPLEKDPEAKRFVDRFLLASVAMRQVRARSINELAEAIRPAEALLERSPDDALAHLAMGALLERAFELMEEASLLPRMERHYRRAVELEPGLAEGHLRLGRVLLWMDSDSDEALEEIDWPVRHSRSPHLHFMSHVFRAKWFQREGNWERAIGSLRAAVSTNGSNQSGLLALSQSLYEVGESQEAVDVLKQALVLPVAEPTYLDDTQLYRAGIFRWLDQFMEEMRLEVLRNTSETVR